jgi:hypothetical protein
MQASSRSSGSVDHATRRSLTAMIASAAYNACKYIITLVSYMKRTNGTFTTVNLVIQKLAQMVYGKYLSHNPRLLANNKIEMETGMVLKTGNMTIAVKIVD